MAQYRQSFSSAAGDQVSLGIRIPISHNKQSGFRNRRSNNRTCCDKKCNKISIGAIAVILSCGLLVTIFTYYRISIHDNNNNNNKGIYAIPIFHFSSCLIF
ncbi:hypothetical protein AQUCO_02300035v1 [Aquilegia coerulea]|uniref:Transmembrane protein n=1 Tax=Aquilegia coerulea TaxID=218851 RepID=A0A2G5DBR7_AQUCA|nr:hypothetical protein AQUCO_02300035v1 [Aquilegia coerulea]